MKASYSSMTEESMERLVMCTLAALLFSFMPAAHAQHVYCKITGQKQGVINAGTTARGWEDYIPVLSLSSSVTMPYDVGSGQATGRRQYSPIAITKSLDRASPLLFLAAVTNENLAEVLCKFLRNNTRGTGTSDVFFELKLSNARIVSDAVSGNAQINNGIHESVGFIFQRIEWTYLDGGVTAVDDWEAR
jgi:type VI secretion system secreted protein Hcp